MTRTLAVLSPRLRSFPHLSPLQNCYGFPQQLLHSDPSLDGCQHQFQSLQLRDHFCPKQLSEPSLLLPFSSGLQVLLHYSLQTSFYFPAWNAACSQGVSLGFFLTLREDSRLPKVF
ncbi:hypothetical protein XELAEV_18025581mg [Xenopus laevis]|uniref:Uncharacterized protein n=1 Tax=Xenopus laevis TaxID=8355 RepID=A0A974HM86_XENLA|nr:hypothetical protein XELAEV_18025581mg [Xenopus laevis]